MLLLERSPRTRINIVLGRLSWDCLIRGLATSFSSSPICATKIVLRAVPPSTPNLKAVVRRRHVTIISVEPTGNYAISGVGFQGSEAPTAQLILTVTSAIFSSDEIPK
uniref:Uncharacterized protein n=1 Tax=Physcomitrium patens TaxID=3218 RepID=A0A7I4ACD2_PHYPA